MTTKLKIIGGFVIMTLLLAALVILGYRTTERSSGVFVEYRRLVQLNVGMSDTATALRQASANMYAFIRSRDEAPMDSARKAVQTAQAIVTRIEPFGRSDSTLKLFADLKQEMTAFTGVMDNVYAAVTDSHKLYAEVVLPNSHTTVDALEALSKQSLLMDNSQALGQISEIWSKMLTLMSGMSRFAESLAEEDAKLIQGYLVAVDTPLEGLRDMMITAEGRAMVADMVKAQAQLKDATNRMDAEAASLRQALAEMDSFLRETSAKVDAFNADVDSRMREAGTQNLADNASALRSMLITGAVGLMLGLAIAMFIVIGIVRTLKGMAAYAGAVARGDFAYSLKVREKGEIGAMFAALQEIPHVLDSIITTANALAEDIRGGRMRQRLEPSDFAGEFSKLAQSVNTVSAAYTDMLDAIPVPVMACDAKHSIVFFNKAGQEVVGGNHINMPCKDQLKATECGTQECFGKLAMERLAPVSTETEACPQSGRRNIKVTAMPLMNSKGEAVGYFEAIVDVTEIRQQQATMMEVAREATQISDRVAAASEQLAAQVEEVSRGAELQRDRVTSTASAMSQMNATVLEVARNASEASSQSDRTRSKAEDGATLVNRMVGSINEVNTVGMSLQSNMQQLGGLAEGIGGVMNVISDIADQTNLLALNAAIEAARAGEAGRGFAVVADEVRKLAEKTMEATKEVGGTIDSIQHSARTNLDEVGKAVSSVSEATVRADDSGRALQEIVDIAGGTSAVVASIATAAEEQSATSEEINLAIDEINRIVAETTEGMVQSSAAVQELSAMAQQLKAVMEGLR